MVSTVDVRHELQISSAVISDESVKYAINKVITDDLDLICAEVLRMVLRKHRGLVVRQVGKYREEIDPRLLRKQINEYMHKAASSTFGDGHEHPDAWFTRDGI